MEYRKLGATGLDVSAVALGTEYLINLPRETVVPVIHTAIERGINYFDLFFAQAEFRDNMGAAFKGYRDSVMLAAHLGAAEIDGQYKKTRDPELCRHFFHDFLTRYKTDYVDMLFLHNIDSQEDYDGVMNPGGLLEMATEFLNEGKTRLIGFSGHNTVTSLQAVGRNEIDVLMFPINLANHALPGRKELLEACVEGRIGLVVMKPYAGGNLLSDETIIKVADMQMGRREMPGARMRFTKSNMITPVQCLAYALDQRGVSTIVPGCGGLDELEAALAYLEASEEEREYSSLLPDFAEYRTGQCVFCNHCLPCPSEIDIGLTTRLLKKAEREMTAEVRASYDDMPAKASDCIQCGDCMERCPFGADVITHMEQAVGTFE
jgi:predicted aldo/keto reductase-like oxidoreductase